MARVPELHPRFAAVDHQNINGQLEPEGWDRVELGGRVMPGHARISGGGIQVKHDKKKASGKNGATITTHGVETQDLELTVTVWTNDQLEKLGKDIAFFKKAMYDDPENASWNFDAPAVAFLGIPWVVITHISQLRDSSEVGRGGKEVVFRLAPWSPKLPPLENVLAEPKKNRKPPEHHINNAVTGAGKKPDPATVPGAAGPTGQQSPEPERPNQSFSNQNQSLP